MTPPAPKFSSCLGDGGGKGPLDSALLSRGHPFFRSLRPRGPVAGATYELLTNEVGGGG